MDTLPKRQAKEPPPECSPGRHWWPYTDQWQLPAQHNAIEGLGLQRRRRKRPRAIMADGKCQFTTRNSDCRQFLLTTLPFWNGGAGAPACDSVAPCRLYQIPSHFLKDFLQMQCLCLLCKEYTKLHTSVIPPRQMVLWNSVAGGVQVPKNLQSCLLQSKTIGPS